MNIYLFAVIGCKMALCRNLPAPMAQGDRDIITRRVVEPKMMDIET